MSSRTLRKLLKTDKNKVQLNKDEKESSESDASADEIVPKNKFDLVGFILN